MIDRQTGQLSMRVKIHYDDMVRLFLLRSLSSAFYQQVYRPKRTLAAFSAGAAPRRLRIQYLDVYNSVKFKNLKIFKNSAKFSTTLLRCT